MKVKLIKEENYNLGKLDVKEKSIEIDNVEWKYTVSGNGNKMVLAILANTTGHLLALPLAENFSLSHTIVALSVPPISTFSKTADGLKALLDFENISSCDAIGQSNGGVYIQSLVSKYPEYIDKIVFSHSLTSMDKNDAYTINASELKVYKKIKTILKICPVSFLIFALQKLFVPKIHLVSGNEATIKLKHLCKSDLKKLTKQDFLTMSRCMEDFLYNYTFDSTPYSIKPDKILIIDSESDKLANPMQRQEMLRLCPNAKEYHFKSGGHVTVLNCQEEYFSILEKFWLD